MADPLGAAGSVAGLVSLAIQLSQLSFQYVSIVTGSSKAWSSYIQELSTLTSVLLKLQRASDHAGAQNLSHILPTPGVSTDTIRECYNELDSLKSTLSEKLVKRGLRRKLEMLSWPFSEPETQKRVVMLHRFSSLFESSLVADNLTVSVESYRHLKDEKDIKEFNELLNWFKPKYESLPLSPEVVLEPMCPGTRSALLSSDAYVNWRDSVEATTQQPLWIYGPPGAGKSVLSAAIVNDILSHSDTIVACHFFRDSQEETLQDVLRHIAYQLLSQPTAVSQVAIEICKNKMARSASLLLKDLVDVICDISTSSDRAYIILDGLDEFSQFTKLLKHLPQFVAANAKVIVSSRELPSIAAHMTNAMLVDARAGHQDTELYVQWRLEEESEIDEELLTDDLKRDIVSKLAEQTNGSFLLARFIMDSICNATTIKKIRNILDSMPTNYEEAYKGTFDRILKNGQERRSLALSALGWICNSRRSLDMTELRHAIESLDEAPEYTSECLEPATAILSSCFGLLVHSKSTQTVDLVHLSAREFVLEQLNSQAEDSNITIGRACLRYMAAPEMAKGPCQSLDELKTRITEMPFLDYATRYYGYHVRPVEDDLLADLVKFLSDEKYRESSWQMLHFVVGTESQSAQDLITGIPSQATILHVSCYWGFYSLLRKSLATPSGLEMLDKADSHGWSPLHWASSNGHSQLAADLLEAGANINTVDKASWTPLFWAVVRGHDAVARLLLDRGSSLFNQDQTGLTAVHWAILAGARDMTTLLLEQARTSDRSFRSPISRLTVEEAKAISMPKRPKNLFQLVTEISDTESFEKLASSYRGLYSLDDIGFDTSDVSALWDQTKVVLSKGESRFWWKLQEKAPIDGVRKQLLTNAIQCEDVELVKSILNLSRDLGRDLANDVVSARGAGYVHVAAYSGSPEIMRMIIQTKLSLTAADLRGLTPLHYTCRSGNREVLKVILEANVEVDARDQHQRTPLMLLLLYGGWRTCHTPGDARVMLDALIVNGASIHAKDSDGRQPIHYAMVTMDPDIIQTLADLGADPRAISDGLRTPLHVLAEGYFDNSYDLEAEGFSSNYYQYRVPTSLDETVTKLVLRISPPGALQAETATNATALALAIKRRRWILAQALHAADAPFRCNDDLSDVLGTLAENGFYELVQILIKAGVTLKGKDFFPEIHVVLPAQKRHRWDWRLFDISESEAFPRRNHALVLKELLAVGVNVNHKHLYHKLTAIQIAVERGINDTSYLAALLDGGADPYAETDDGLDSFDLALLRGKLDNLAILIQHAALDLSRDHWLTNWLRESGTVPQCGQESFEACIAAIRHSELYALSENNGHTLLFHAVREGNLVLAEELIKLGSTVNSSDPLGWTPFHEAVRTHRADLVEFLISEGANVLATVEDTSPFSASSTVLPHPDEPAPMINALHIAVGIHPHRMDLDARNHFSPDIVRLLLENGIDPNAKAMNVGSLRECSVNGDASPLQIMFRKWGPTHSPEFFAIVQLLIDFGADVRGIVEGFDVWDVASFEGFESLWDILRNAEPVR